MRAVAKVTEAVRPQIEAMQKMKLPEMTNLLVGPVIPNSLRDEDGEFYLPPMSRPVQEVRIVNPEVFSNNIVQVEAERVAVSYPLPPGAVWESLTIKFLDGHFVKVSYIGIESKKFDYKDMGFINMKTTKPDLKWKLLQTIAENGGALMNAKWDRKFGRNVKYELNAGLKRFFQMEENPIPHYTKQRGYRPLFILKSDQ